MRNGSGQTQTEAGERTKGLERQFQLKVVVRS